MELELTRSQLVRWRTADLRDLPRERPVDRDVGVAGARHQGHARRRQHPDRPAAARRRRFVDHRRVHGTGDPRAHRRQARDVLGDDDLRRRRRDHRRRNRCRRTRTGSSFAGLVAVRLRQRLARRDDERRGRRDREAVRQDDHAAVPRLLQLRHRDRRRDSASSPSRGDSNVFAHTTVMAVFDPRDRLRRASRTSPPAQITMDPVDEADRKSWRERLHVAMSAWREPRTYAHRPHHPGHGLRRGRRERLARARRRRGPWRGRGTGRRGARGLLGQHDRGSHVRRPARRPIRPRRHPARARGDRRARPAAVHPRAQLSRWCSWVPRCGARVYRSASRSGCRPRPTTRQGQPRG